MFKSTWHGPMAPLVTVLLIASGLRFILPANLGKIISVNIHTESVPLGLQGTMESLMLVKGCFDCMVSALRDGWRTHRRSMWLRQHCVAATCGGFGSVWNGGSFRW